MGRYKPSLNVTYLKVTFLMISIPLLNNLGYWIGSYYHEPVDAEISSAPFGPMYEFTILWMIFFSAIFLCLVCYIHDQLEDSKVSSFALHLAYCGFIYGTTKHQLVNFPYEHLLQMIACWTTLITKPILDYTFYKLLK